MAYRLEGEITMSVTNRTRTNTAKHGKNSEKRRTQVMSDLDSVQKRNARMGCWLACGSLLDFDDFGA